MIFNLFKKTKKQNLKIQLILCTYFPKTQGNETKSQKHSPISIPYKHNVKKKVKYWKITLSLPQISIN